MIKDLIHLKKENNHYLQKKHQYVEQKKKRDEFLSKLKLRDGSLPLIKSLRGSMNQESKLSASPSKAKTSRRITSSAVHSTSSLPRLPQIDDQQLFKHKFESQSSRSPFDRLDFVIKTNKGIQVRLAGGLEAGPRAAGAGDARESEQADPARPLPADHRPRPSTDRLDVEQAGSHRQRGIAPDSN